MKASTQTRFLAAKTSLFGTISLLTLGLAVGPASAAEMAAAQQNAGAEAEVGVEDVQPDEEAIVITGFRRSLESAINLKRDSVSMVDAIVAEDIAKFPDQNLAESLQRIPGVAIEREGGEGRRISVRGLSSEFTRVRINGLETIAATGDNQSRAFDFDVFASELFSSLVVHKSAQASLDEGSLGAVVDLNTGNPLAGKEGLTLAASAQGSYNSYSEKVKPRLAALLSWKSPSGTLGASISAAYSETLSVELGSEAARWAQAPFDSVDGVACWTAPNRGGSYVPSAGCDEAALAFHARIPRYVDDRRTRERLGLTGSVHWQPTDSTKVAIDGLYSTYDELQEFRTVEVLFRGNERQVDLSDYVIDEHNTIVRGTFDDAWVRSEYYERQMNTDFHQLSARWDQDVTDTFRFTLLGGFSRSEGDVPYESAIMLDDRDAANFFYDFSSNSRAPVIRFGTDVTDPSTFQLSELRDSITNTVNKFRTLSLKSEWDVTEEFRVSAGGFYRRYSFDTESATRNTVVCPSLSQPGPDVVLGTITCTPNSVFGPGAVYGFPVTDDLVELFQLSSAAGAPDGTTTSWVVADLAAAAQYTGLYGLPARPNQGAIRGVVEKTKGGYLQFDVDSEIGGLRYALNAGIRYARTDQSSRGYISGEVRTVERSYEDWLPSANLSLFPTENVILRAAIAEVMTRPALNNITPGGNVDGFNYRINFGNPDLEPYRATSYDLALEWYFRPQSLFSVAVFKKDVSSFPINQTITGTYASTGLPLSLINPSSPAATNPEGAPWSISSIVNGEGAKLKGLELSLQSPFWFLPGVLSNFGGIANATFISSSADYTVPGPAVEITDGRLVPVPVQVSGELLGLSKRSYNGTLYYEDDRFGARVSGSYRSSFFTGAGTNGGILEGTSSSLYVDASMSYDLTDWITLSLEGINLTNEKTDIFSDLASDRLFIISGFGRTITAGVRISL